jgi:hypothetical protein
MAPAPATKLTRFWLAIESIPGQAATLAEWRHRLGTEFDLVKSLLRSTGTLAGTIPSIDIRASSPLLQVVRHADDDIIGVSEEGDRFALTKEQIVILELDRREFTKRVCSALDLQPATNANSGISHDHIIGTYELQGIRHPAFLVIALEDEAFDSAVNAILCAREQPCVIFAPTAHRIGQVARQRLETRGLLALADLMVVADDGQFACTENPRNVLLQVHRIVTGTPQRADGVYPPDTIVFCGRESQCNLTKREMAFLQLGIVERDIDVHRLMHVKDGLLWKERYLNAKSARDKISQFLSRLNTKLTSANPPLGCSFSLLRNANFVSRSDPGVRPLTVR